MNFTEWSAPNFPTHFILSSNNPLHQKPNRTMKRAMAMWSLFRMAKRESEKHNFSCCCELVWNIWGLRLTEEGKEKRRSEKRIDNVLGSVLEILRILFFKGFCWWRGRDKSSSFLIWQEVTNLPLRLHVLRFLVL